MKIALIQQNYKVGDLDANAAKIAEAARFALQKGAELAVFPRDALTGTPLFDMGRGVAFRQEKERYMALLNDQIEGIEAVFDSTECEHVQIRCAADYFRHGAAEANLERLRQEAHEIEKPVIWVNQVGAQTDTIFYGGSVICYPDGEVFRMPLFEEAIVIFETEDPVPASSEWGSRLCQVRQALVSGIRDYFAKSGVADACVALSGGLDSAVVLALAVEALGPEHLRVLMLPSEYSTGHSVSDSEEMIRRLGVKSDLVSIAPAFDTVIDSLAPVWIDAPGHGISLAEENIQARIRCVMTMALSNSHNALMLNTSNKSEAAVGYGTLYGDTSGALSVIGDLYKTEVYELANYLNQSAVGEGKTPPIPQNIIDKAPSAELRHDQKDSDALPDYPVLDAILYRLVELGRSSADVVAEGYDDEVVGKVCRLLLAGDFKRYQLPPVLRLSGCTFGKERVWPITAKKIL